ncbi:MAG: aldehyde dehydrogenase family protein, partial [Thermosynechococcaceae cyanobacterium]
MDRETVTEQADRLVLRLQQSKQRWLQVSIPERIRYLDHCLHVVKTVAQSWVEVSCQGKGIDPQSAIAGEEWITGPFAVMRSLRLLIRTLTDGRDGTLRTRGLRSPHQTAVSVFPHDLFDRLMLMGVKGEVWLQPGCDPEQGQHWPEEGQVALVLGAGNISAIGPLDVLHQLFAENRVALLKMNPVNASVGPWIAQLFGRLHADGFVEIVYGGAELGAYLCQHPGIDTIHITGSERTHDAIVWGDTPTEQTHRKATATPKLTKSITSELGGLTPVIVVPGHWSQRDLAFQARHVASMVVHNAGFDCVAGKVLVVSQDWPQREQFLTLMRQQLQQIPPRKAFYPGTGDRYERFLAQYPAAEVLGATAAGCIPWTLAEVPPQAGEYALTEEVFCGILAVASLPTHSPDAFLAEAVQFVNETVYGTLSCTVLIDAPTQKREAMAFEQAIADLRYGSIGVNIWSGALFVMPELPWGAFPGHDLAAIGSGRGFVHNTFLLKHPQKAVVYAPFR